MDEHCSVFISWYRAALFDMDGVVTDTMPLHLKAWQEAFKPHGVEVAKMDVYLREGMQSPVMAREIAREKGLLLSEPDLEQIVDAKERIFGRGVDAGVCTFDGAAATLQMLRNNGLKTALVTGSRASPAKKVLEAAGVGRLFDVIVTGDDTTRGKPDPDPYRKAIEKAGVNRIDCVVIENAPLGIRSAKAAGVGYVIAVTTSLGKEYLQEADDIVDSIADLEQCLARRFAARPPL